MFLPEGRILTRAVGGPAPGAGHVRTGIKHCSINGDLLSNCEACHIFAWTHITKQDKKKWRPQRVFLVRKEKK